MSEGSARLSDERMDAAMGRLLQVGVLIASAVVLVGGALSLWGNRAARVDYRTFASEPARLREWGQLLPAVGRGEPAAIVQIGVLLLIATPVARVVFAMVAFAIQRDRLYVGISFVVLLVLMVGLFFLR